MRFDVITLFPELFGPFLEQAMVGIARRSGLVEIAVHDLRDWTEDRHRTADDAPYGGGPGMLMKAEPLVAAIEAVAGGPRGARRAEVVLLSPQGRLLDQERLQGIARAEHVVLVCGRYEGVDQRVIELAVDTELSVGDYVLSGGEIPAMLVIEGAVRLVPGVLGNAESARTESFQSGLLEGPQYTRPAEFRGHRVPEVLLSGDHAAVSRWRSERALALTRERRPDLLQRRGSGRDAREERRR